MYRELRKEDKALFLQMVDELYHSNAVLHPIPKENMLATFEELLRSDEYLSCYILEYEDAVAGYVLLAKTFSPEAGGVVIWIEDLYVKEQYRSHGLGSAFLKEFTKNPPKNTKRIRLEVEPTNTRAAALYQRLGFQELPYNQMVFDD